MNPIDEFANQLDAFHALHCQRFQFCPPASPIHSDRTEPLVNPAVSTRPIASKSAAKISP